MTNQPVVLTRSALETVQTEATRTFPDECCGLLLGPRGARRIDEARPQPNVHEGPRARRYRMDPRVLFDLDDELERAGRAMVGIFHSHPLQPADPSDVDRATAWPGLVYLIQQALPQGVGDLRAWSLDERRTFTQVPLRVEP